MPRPFPSLSRPRFLVVLVAMLVILIVTPIVQRATHPTMWRMLGVLGLVVPVLAVSAAGDVGRPRRIAMGLAILSAVTNADAMTGVTRLPSQVGIAVSLVFLAYTTIRLVSGVLRSREVTGDVIIGALASYMLVGLTWAVGYGLLETVRPGSISGAAEGSASLDFPALLYFSYITMLTIGYGDITPLSSAARMMTVLEGLIGMTFTTILLAVLVATHLGQRRSEDRGGD